MYRERYGLLTCQVADPVGVRVSGEDESVADLVIVQVIEHPGAVGSVAIPSVL